MKHCGRQKAVAAGRQHWWQRWAFRRMLDYVRPGHRGTSVCLTGPCFRVTRLYCRGDKDKLQPRENICALFFNPSSFFFLSLVEFQQHATPKGEVGLASEQWGRSRPSLRHTTPRQRHRSATVFYHGTCLPSQSLCAPRANNSPLWPTPPKKDLELIPVLFHTTFRAGQIDPSRSRQAIFVFLGD